jgi:membrane fusion protein (multidrug efflux system)
LRSRGFDTQAQYDQTVAQLQSARARRARLQAVINQKSLRAPFDGVAGIPRVEVGQYVPAGTVATTFQDLKLMRVDFTVPEQMVAKLKLGQAVRVGVSENDLTLTGVVTGIDPRIDPQTRLASVRAELARNEEEPILPGQFLQVRVELPKEPSVVTVPQTAVISSLYGDFVYAVETDDKANPPRKVARQVFVKIGRREGGASEVLSGVKPGDVVIVSGQNKLQAGGAVVIDNSISVNVPANGRRRS